MKDGDLVRVKFEDGFELYKTVLVDHTDDFKNVTVKTDRGGLMNGMVESIEVVPEYVVLDRYEPLPVVYPEAKGIK